MKHPDPEKCRQLGQIFLDLHIKKPEAEVDMLETKFNQCGTVACHAGWYAVARGLNLTVDYNFQSSSDDMAKYLGLEGGYELRQWANANNKLWGNRDGYFLFSSSDAFGVDSLSYKPLTLDKIGNHWLAVADRIESYG